MDVPFMLRVGPFGADALRVTAFTAAHRMNALYEVSVSAWASDLEVDGFDRAILGAAATLTIDVPGAEPRLVHGTVVAAFLEGRFDRGRIGVRATLAPRAFLLQKRVGSRIFQDLTVREIIDRVLDAAGVARTWRLGGAYPKRQYCLQYQESDWAFVARLLAEEGIFFWFEHPTEALPVALRSSEVLVLSDAPAGHPGVPGSAQMVYRPRTASVDLREGTIADLRLSTRIEATTAQLGDYDFRRPLLDLVTRTGSLPGGLPGSLPGSLPGGLPGSLPGGLPGGLPSAPEALDLVVYDHHGEYEETDVDILDAGGHARKYLEQLRARAVELTGEGPCRRLVPGHRFHLEGHDLDRLNGEYTITSLDEHAALPDAVESAGEPTYSCTFGCVPAEVPFRPPRPPRRIQQVTEVAVVVGPVGHDIHVDEHGRIKVQFPWDREGRHDEHSSCWMRVLQPWGGEGWGSQFIPRIGMEVLVAFLGGDVDRPVILGSLYNTAHPVPHALPVHATRSGIRTRTSPGGGGANEIMFEDAAGREELATHATLDQTEHVGRDLTTTVARDRRQRVEGDKASSVGGKRNDDTTGDRDDVVHGGHKTRVDGASTLEVGGDRVEEIGGGQQRKIGGDLRESIHGQVHRFVGGSVVDIIAGDRSESSDGTDRRSARGDTALVSGGALSLEAAGGISFAAGTARKPAVARASVSGDLAIDATGRLDLGLGKAVRLEIGDSLLEIGPDEIVITGKKLTFKVEELTLAAGDAILSLKDKVEVRGQSITLASAKDAILELGDEAKLDGNAIKLGSKNSAEALEVAKREEQKATCGKVSIHLFDLAGHPVQNAVWEACCFGWIDAGEAASGVIEVPDFPDVERIHVKWSRPAGERPQGADPESWEFEKDVYLKTEAGSEEETMRRQLHNLGFEDASAHRAAARYGEATGVDPLDKSVKPGADVAQRHTAVSPVKREKP